jgi:hypothetical protein
LLIFAFLNFLSYNNSVVGILDLDRRPGIPSYLDAGGFNGEKVGRWPISVEKRGYLDEVARLVKTLPFGPKENICVLGVGQGGESAIIAEILQERYPQGDGPTLMSVDINIFVMDAVDRRYSTLLERQDTPQARLRSGLQLANAANLYRLVRPGSSRLTTISSYLHEAKSRRGWNDGLVHDFKQAARAATKEGLIVVRDFCPPEFRPSCQLTLRTELAERFFVLFASTFNPHVMPGFAEEPWERQGNVVTANSYYIFELVTHFRMFFNDWYNRAWGGINMFFPTFWKQWEAAEMSQSYVLTRRKFQTMEAVCNELLEQSRDSGRFTYDFRVIDDSADDNMLQEHFGCPEVFPSQRFRATFIKQRTGKI